MNFRKTGRASQISHEVAGLRWLADAAPGSAPVVPVIESGETWLIEPRLVGAVPTPRAAAEFGAALARLHASGAAAFGSPPPEAPDDLGWIGRARLSLQPETSWGAFYSRQRIRPYLSAPFTADERRLLLRLCELLESGRLDHPQPRLVRAPAARLHGDLWNGNVMWTPAGVVLIDPAAHGGHGEDDLGALALFGTPYLDAIFEGYQEVSPLAPGWEGRLPLHQMHLLVVHAQLFGGGYLSQSVEVAATILLEQS